ncbi:MAG TPA: hypothetical protein VJN29_12435, partial [Intrasporangium sp.]|uniref:hypothetical protein n=1 Tax=Intrasporangium sp. TaxID=1925024 RepID=UPI002B466B50
RLPVLLSIRLPVLLALLAIATVPPLSLASAALAVLPLAVRTRGLGPILGRSRATVLAAVDRPIPAAPLVTSLAALRTGRRGGGVPAVALRLDPAAILIGAVRRHGCDGGSRPLGTLGVDSATRSG